MSGESKPYKSSFAVFLQELHKQRRERGLERDAKVERLNTLQERGNAMAYAIANAPHPTSDELLAATHWWGATE